MRGEARLVYGSSTIVPKSISNNVERVRAMCDREPARSGANLALSEMVSTTSFTRDCASSAPQSTTILCPEIPFATVWKDESGRDVSTSIPSEHAGRSHANHAARVHLALPREHARRAAGGVR